MQPYFVGHTRQIRIRGAGTRPKRKAKYHESYLAESDRLEAFHVASVTREKSLTMNGKIYLV
jgi:hypothetical protein